MSKCDDELLNLRLNEIKDLNTFYKQYEIKNRYLFKGCKFVYSSINVRSELILPIILKSSLYKRPYPSKHQW